MELPEAYWRHYVMAFRGDRQQRMGAQELDWAEEEVHQAMQDPLGAVKLMVDLADAAPDDEALSYLGAGPIEELVGRFHADVVQEVDDAARQNDRFRYALRSAWLDGKVPDPVRDRLRRFGPPP